MESEYKRGQEIILLPINLPGVITDTPHENNQIYYVSYFDLQAVHRVAQVHACQMKPREAKN